jgi:hypothetical protein
MMRLGNKTGPSLALHASINEYVYGIGSAVIPFGSEITARDGEQLLRARVKQNIFA